MLRESAESPTAPAVAQPSGVAGAAPEKGEHASADAFSAIYREHLHFVWRSVRRLGIREADAEDAVQEVFLVIHRRLSTFNGTSQFRSWVYGICMHVVRGRRRKANERLEVFGVDEELPPELSVTDPTKTIDRKKAAALLDLALDTLPLEQRATFTLFELENLSCQEIAELTEVPVGTVYSRLRLAREGFHRATARIRAQFSNSVQSTGES